MASRAQITDRAHRYRANQMVQVEGGRCLFCGSDQFLVPDHWDGHPDHTHPGNLEVLCKSCNTAKGSAFKRAGRGRLTNQYNPTRGGGAANIGEWMNAVGAITPHVDRGDRGLVTTMSTREAVDMIRATPQSKRREFAAQLRRRRNPFWGQSDARQTTPARGGIAYHSSRRPAASGGRKKKAPKEEAGGLFSVPDEAKIQEGFKKGLSLREILGNPAASYRGMSVEKLERIRPHVAVLTVDNDWLVRDRGRRELDKLDKALDNARKRESRKNPAEGSAKVFEEFHGFEPSEVVTVTKKVHYHSHLAAAGKLIQLDVWGVDETGHKIRGFKGALLAFNEDKNQLFVEGGDQSINLGDFGIDSPHELETLGRLTDIGYHTNKTHLGDEGGEAVYIHKFRSTNRGGKHVIVKIARYPDLIYDVRNEQLLFSGGSYEILAEGINK
jgi:hypothetical protein